MLVAVIEWGDDEFNLSARAEAFYKRAESALMATVKSREMMDSESGGESVMASMSIS
jgi:hypothetical protein